MLGRVLPVDGPDWGVGSERARGVSTVVGCVRVAGVWVGVRVKGGGGVV